MYRKGSRLLIAFKTTVLSMSLLHHWICFPGKMVRTGLQLSHLFPAVSLKVAVIRRHQDNFLWSCCLPLVTYCAFTQNAGSSCKFAFVPVTIWAIQNLPSPSMIFPDFLIPPLWLCKRVWLLTFSSRSKTYATLLHCWNNWCRARNCVRLRLLYDNSILGAVPVHELLERFAVLLRSKLRSDAEQHFLWMYFWCPVFGRLLNNGGLWRWFLPACALIAGTGSKLSWYLLLNSVALSLVSLTGGLWCQVLALRMTWQEQINQECPPFFFPCTYSQF